MDRQFKLGANILICLIILAGFVAVAFTSYKTFSKIINDDIVNISKLTSTSIYSDIRNELTKPIFVSLTMANDSFLKNWLRHEQVDNSVEHQEELRQYLLGLKKKYDYDSVFLVSDVTKKYYHFNGLNKVVSKNSAHDVWYYTFVESGLVYNLDVDTDEANDGHLSVFVNCRMTGDDGKFMGVTGVGLEMNQVQHLLKTFEDEYGLEALLFGDDGTVWVDTSSDGIGELNVFDIDILNQNRQKIIANRNALQVFQFKKQPFDGYYIVRYIEDLNWYLLVKKDTSVLERSMYKQTMQDAFIYIMVVTCMLIIADFIIKKNDRIMLRMMRTDLLTGLLNRRGFNENLQKAVNGAPEQGPLSVFVFDIDNFKRVNDTYGHLVGDNVLCAIGKMAAGVFAERGMVCRWGGDEFAGYYFGDKQQATEVLERFFSVIGEDPSFRLYKTTVSLGMTSARKIDTADTLISRADQALYKAKENGKAHWVIIDEPYSAV